MKLTAEIVSNFFNRLIEAKLIQREDILFENDDEFNHNIAEIRRISVKGEDLRVNIEDGKLEYFENNEWRPVPEMDTGVEKSAIFLKNRIPPFTFKTSSDYSDFKNAEIEAIYISSVLVSILSDVFSEEFKDIIDSYDYDALNSDVMGESTFQNFVENCLKLQSKTILAIVSACRQNISEKKEVYSSLNLSLLSKQERIKLESMKKEINFYFNEFKDKRLHIDKVKELKRSEIYALYEEREKYIREKIINSPNYSDVRTLYYIDRLNYEDINVFHKKKMINTAKAIICEMTSGDSLSKEMTNELINKLNRKGIRVYTRRWRNLELKKFINNREGYILPKKV